MSHVITGDDRHETLLNMLAACQHRLEFGVRHLEQVLEPVLTNSSAILSDRDAGLAGYVNGCILRDAEEYGTITQLLTQEDVPLEQEEEAVDKLFDRWELQSDILDQLLEQKDARELSASN